MGRLCHRDSQERLRGAASRFDRRQNLAPRNGQNAVDRDFRTRCGPNAAGERFSLGDRVSARHYRNETARFRDRLSGSPGNDQGQTAERGRVGQEDSPSLLEVTSVDTPPAHDEVEVTVIGPGYGESAVVHIGGGSWVVVDSCCDHLGKPRALTYLHQLGVDASRRVVMVVATHWHDDHIRGLAEIVGTCSDAVFCCSGAFLDQEFLMAVAAFEQNEPGKVGSGARELYAVFSGLVDSDRVPKAALADRRILRLDSAEVWALSPDDDGFRDFVRTAGRLIPSATQTQSRMATPTANAVSVVLQVRAGEAEVLLGADLERSGWRAILDSSTRPQSCAGVFKVPHHGSRDADEPEVWRRMLQETPNAVLAPWGLAGRTIPTDRDVQRLLARTPNAWASARRGRVPRPRSRREIARTIREAGGTLLGDSSATGMVRLRCGMEDGSRWRVDIFGDACHLRDYAT